jgi:hypothetical protein
MPATSLLAPIVQEQAVEDPPGCLLAEPSLSLLGSFRI